MALRTLVKVGNITNLSEARYCAGMNVDLLGFVTVASQENYLPPSSFQDIRGWLAGPKIVAEVYGLTSEEQFQQIVADYRPDYIELTEAELPFANTELPLLLRTEKSVLPARTIYGVISHQPDAELPAGVFLFADTTDVAQITSLLDQEQIQGIVLAGTREESPGMKDYDHLSEILESLEVD
jgi:phosphoribosylanthranilate isomerase